MKSRLLPVLLMLLLALPASAMAKHTPKHARHHKVAIEKPILIPAIEPIVLTYDVYVGGANLMTADIIFQEQQAGYRARVMGRTVGFWYRLFPWRTELKSEGKIDGDKFVPKEYYTKDSWNDKPKSTWLHYKPDGDIMPEFDPPNTDQNREEVTKEMRVGALDPVAGLLQLMANVAVHKSCNMTVPIFEGKRRFDITGVDVGNEDIDESDYNTFKGTARTCDTGFKMVAGEWKDKTHAKFWMRSEKESGRDPFHIWLGSIDPSMPEMPVRLESGSVWGIIVMHLSAWRKATPADLNY